MSYTVEIKGLRELMAQLDKFPADLEKRINGQMERGAQVFVRNAQRDAPRDVGFLKGQITYKPIPVRAMSVEIVSGSEYSPYMEWGTKGNYRSIPGTEEYAAQFKGKGKGGNPKKFIYQWCKRKGIEPRLWYVVYRSIMTNGVKAHPFFFKQLPLAKATIENGIAAELKNITL